jgi:hypothetical protein
MGALRLGDVYLSADQCPCLEDAFEAKLRFPVRLPCFRLSVRMRNILIRLICFAQFDLISLSILARKAANYCKLGSVNFTAQ